MASPKEDPILKKIASGDSAEKREALSAVTERPRTGGFGIIDKALAIALDETEDEPIRRAALRAAVHEGYDVDTVHYALMDLIREEQEKISLAAARELARCENLTDPELIQDLQVAGRYHPDPAVRKAVVESLREITGDRGSGIAEELRPSLDPRGNFLGEKYDRGRPEEQADLAAPASRERKTEQTDVFISYASEDREWVGRLIRALGKRDLKVWYDQEVLRPGDRLKENIDPETQGAAVAVVILTPNYIGKKWTDYELDQLLAREYSGEHTVIPVWRGVTEDDVEAYRPELLDIVSLNTEKYDLDAIAGAIAARVGKQ